MAEQSEMKTLQSWAGVDDQTESDDFELISDSSLNDAANAGMINEDQSPTGQEQTENPNGEQGNIRVLDPLEAFEMIQSEHRLLKDELTTQNRMLRQRITDFEDFERRKADEITELKKALNASAAENKSLVSELSESSMQMSTLKKEVEATRIESNKKDEQQREVERQLKYFKECSETVDQLTVKLMVTEEMVKTQDDMLKQYQNDGFASNAPRPSPLVSIADQHLTIELRNKEEQIKRLEGTLSNLESSFGTMHAERLKSDDEIRQLTHMNLELQDLVNDLQTQAEADKAEWGAIRVDLEQQIQILSDRVAAFERHFNSGPSMNDAEAEVHTLTHRDIQSRHGSQTGSSEYHHCPRCHLPMANVGPHPCPSIIDGLD